MANPWQIRSSQANVEEYSSRAAGLAQARFTHQQPAVRNDGLQHGHDGDDDDEVFMIPRHQYTAASASIFPPSSLRTPAAAQPLPHSAPTFPSLLSSGSSNIASHINDGVGYNANVFALDRPRLLTVVNIPARSSVLVFVSKMLIMPQNSAGVNSDNRLRTQGVQNQPMPGQRYGPASPVQPPVVPDRFPDLRNIEHVDSGQRSDNRPWNNIAPPPTVPALSQSSAPQPITNRTGYTDDDQPPLQEAPFRPSEMLDPSKRARRENPTQREKDARVASGVSENNRGDHRLACNRPADIDPEQNCSIWITELPVGITYNELLGSIRDTGRVWASVIQPADDGHRRAAAKGTFFTAFAAQTLHDRANDPTGPGLVIRGIRAVVRRDRNPVAEPREPGDHTRVISIYGPTDIVNEESLTRYFCLQFVYETDEIVWLVRGRAINFIEWRFGSYRCQAQWAFQNLANDPLLVSRGVQVRFRRDPCDWY
jgi:hypothetical protein